MMIKAAQHLFTVAGLLLLPLTLCRLLPPSLDYDDYFKYEKEISAKEIGQIHNEMIQVFHGKMKASGAPRSKAEYLEMVLKETTLMFCEKNDFACEYSQKRVFYEELGDLTDDLARIENGTFTANSIIPLDIDLKIADLFQTILNTFSQYSEDGDISRVKDFLDQLIDDVEEMFDTKSKIKEIATASKAAIIAVQAAASVAGSSLELWSDQLADPKSVFYNLLYSMETEGVDDGALNRRVLQAVNGNEIEGPQNSSAPVYMIDRSCGRRLVAWTAIRDVKASMRKTLSLTFLKLLIEQTPWRWTRLIYKMLKSAITSSLTVYGVDLPKKSDLLFRALGNCCNITNPFPQKNVTKVCSLRVPVD